VVRVTEERQFFQGESRRQNLKGGKEKDRRSTKKERAGREGGRTISSVKGRKCRVVQTKRETRRKFGAGSCAPHWNIGKRIGHLVEELWGSF